MKQVRTSATHYVQLSKGAFLKHVGEHTVALGPKGERIVVLDAQASHLLSYLNVPHTLEDLKTLFTHWPDEVFEQVIALLLATNVLSPVQLSRDVIQDESRNLVAWLCLTNRCNLSCQYCYVPSGSQRMDESTAKRAVNAVYRSALAYGHTRVSLKYAGGEPTLNFDALQCAQRQAEILSARTGIELDAVILTNGICLKESQIDTLLAHRIQPVISLDGIGSYQDMQRPLAGRVCSSFALVENTLERLMVRGIAPHISITITGQSVRGLSELVEYLLERQLHFSFNFYREPDGSPNQKTLTLGPNELVEGIEQAFQVIEHRLPAYSLLSSLTDRADLQVPHTRTCGVGQNYLVIDYNGNISKCQMEAGYPLTTIDANNPLEVVRADVSRVQNISVDYKECRECIWRYRCAGGCPRLTFQYAGRYDARSPLCEVYRRILPRVAHLEALRLLKYEKPWDFHLPVC
jgi:uncharacterized protein